MGREPDGPGRHGTAGRMRRLVGGGRPSNGPTLMAPSPWQSLTSSADEIRQCVAETPTQGAHSQGAQRALRARTSAGSRSLPAEGPRSQGP